MCGGGYTSSSEPAEFSYSGSIMPCSLASAGVRGAFCELLWAIGWDMGAVSSSGCPYNASWKPALDSASDFGVSSIP